MLSQCRPYAGLEQAARSGRRDGRLLVAAGAVGIVAAIRFGLSTIRRRSALARVHSHRCHCLPAAISNLAACFRWAEHTQAAARACAPESISAWLTWRNQSQALSVPDLWTAEYDRAASTRATCQAPVDVAVVRPLVLAVGGSLLLCCWICLAPPPSVDEGARFRVRGAPRAIAKDVPPLPVGTAESGRAPCACTRRHDSVASCRRRNTAASPRHISKGG